MKQLLILLFFYCSLTISGATYYIDPSGKDSNTGSSSTPWKTLAYACSKATTSGDVIHLNAGTYIETNECILAVGVSIEGEGVTSWIKSHYTTTRGTTSPHASITLSSSSEGTNGNQSISNLKLDGDGLTGSIGITVWKRSNVIIHDCTIVDFYINGITVEGFNDPKTFSTRATGNQIYNCTMSNCGDAPGTWNGGGVIQFGGTTGMLIHDNILTQKSRAQGHNGDVIQGDLYHQGTKFYNNKCFKNDNEGGTWNCILENWNCSGGFEIYNNEFHGGDGAIDLGASPGSGGNTKGSYAYSYYIHNNLFTGTPISGTGGQKSCMDIEGVLNSDIWIYNNHMVNLPRFILCDNGTGYDDQVNNVFICYNILENCGWSGADYDDINLFYNDRAGSTLSNVYIYNNVIIGNGVTNGDGIRINNIGSIKNFNVKNNIFSKCSNNGFLVTTNSGSINGLYVDNNTVYNNSSNAPYFSGNAASNSEFLNNLTSDPLFVSSTNFHLQTGSPAIGKGLTISGLTTDYDGNTIKNPPTIGAYENASTPPVQVLPVYQSSSVANITPSLLEITYNLSLNNLVIPVSSSFTVLVNSIARTVNTVAVSGTKVQLTLSTAIKYGDIVTVSYTKPATNPLQTTAGGVATTILAQSTINNLINTAKDGIPVAITMTISPNHVHKILNTLLAYSSTPTTANSPEIIRISDLSGNLFIEKVLVTGVTNIKIPINLSSGIYTVMMTSGGQQMASQKMIVY
jgi:uncharacterized repeat protein (TIGR02059 family)